MRRRANANARRSGYTRKSMAGIGRDCTSNVSASQEKSCRDMRQDSHNLKLIGSRYFLAVRHPVERSCGITPASRLIDLFGGL